MKISFKKVFEKIDKGQSSRVVIYMLSQIVLQGIAIIAMPLFTRLLTTEQYGRVSVYSAWVSILALFIGLRVDATVSVAKAHYSESEFKKFCTNAYLIVALTGIIVFLVTCMGAESLSKALRLSPIIVIFMVLHAFATVSTKVQSGIFLMNKKAVNDMMLSVALSLFGCVISVILISCMNSNEDEARMLGMGMPYVIIGGVSCIWYLRKLGSELDKDMIQYMITLSVPMIFHGLSALVLSQSDRIMISEMVNDDQAGIYSFCYSVATPLTAIWSALGSAWKPDYYENLKTKNNKWLNEHSDNYMFLFTCLTCGYLLVAGEALKILGTKEYWSGIPVLPLISLSCYFQFLYSFPVNYEMYCKKTRIIGLASTITAILNLGLNMWLIPIYGMLGAAVATLSAYIVLFIIHDFSARRMERYHYKWKFYIKGLIPVLICCTITYIFEDIVWVRWGIGIIIGVILVGRVLKKRTLL